MRRDQLANVMLAACGLYALVTVAWSVFPVERWLPSTLAYPVAGQGCERAGVLVASMRAPEVRARVLPIVMASEEAVGEENPLAAESCDYIVERLRSGASWMVVIPRRYICARVRGWAKRRYEDIHQSLGGEIWIIDGAAVPYTDVFTAVTSQGLKFRRAGSRYELVLLDGV